MRLQCTLFLSCNFAVSTFDPTVQRIPGLKDLRGDGFDRSCFQAVADWRRLPPGLHRLSVRLLLYKPGGTWHAAISNDKSGKASGSHCW